VGRPWGDRMGRWIRSVPPWQEPLHARDGVGMLVLYLGAVLAWCAALTPLEAALGFPLLRGGSVATTSNYLDALWHLATGLAIAVPSRNLRLCAVLPLLSLGLDVDHLFGGLLPAPFPREAHDLVFLLLAAAAMWVVAGRFLAGAVAAGWIAHVAVDGGAFPLLAPFAATAYPLPYPGAVAALVGALLLGFLAVHPVRALGERRAQYDLAGTAVGLALLLLWVAPGFSGITSG
jgi:hypothetical protein